MTDPTTPANVPADASSPAPSAPPPKKPRRWLRWTLGVVVVLGLLVAFLPNILSAGVTRGLIHSWLEDNVETQVAFGDLDVTWTDGITLHDLKVYDAAGSPEPLLHAPSVHLDAPVLPLLSRRLEVSRFDIDNAVVRVRVGKDGDTNAEGVVRRKPARKGKRDRRGKDDEPAEEGVEEVRVFPRINVPVNVRNLTLVLVNERGEEARQEGVTFAGHLTTRDGPTTFDLDIPYAGGSIQLDGEAAIFTTDGVLLSGEERRIDATLVIDALDARVHGDLARLFLGDTPLSGVLDGTVQVKTVGKSGEAAIDLTVGDFALGGAAAEGRARGDLIVTGRLRHSPEDFELREFRVRGPGVTIDADLAGNLQSLEGTATAEADLEALFGELADVGVDLPGRASGKLSASLTATRSPSLATGRVELVGLRAEDVLPDRPPVVIENSLLEFEVVPGADNLEIRSAALRLPDLTLTATGSRRHDGYLDLQTTTDGELGPLLARLRDLGLVPASVSLGGHLAGEAAISGFPNGDQLALNIPRFSLTQGDKMELSVQGSRTRAGELDLELTGAGDLATLLGGGGATAEQLAAVKGTFDVRASAKGPQARAHYRLDQLWLKGDVEVLARGELRPDQTLDARLRASGAITDILRLLARLGFVDREIELAGRLEASAQLAGTRDAVVAPELSLTVSEGPLAVDIRGAIDAAGVVGGNAKATADLAALADAARAAGYLEGDLQLDGTAELGARFVGTREDVEVTDIVGSVKAKDFALDLDGASIGAQGVMQGRVKLDTRLSAITRMLGQQSDAASGAEGKLTGTIVLAGSPSSPEITRLALELVGPLGVEVNGRMSADRVVHANVTARGALQPLVDVAAAMHGAPSRPFDGALDAELSLDGAPDALEAKLKRLSLHAGDLVIEGRGERGAGGDISGELSAKGPLRPLLELLAAAAVVENADGDGTLDVTASATAVGDQVQASVNATVRALDLREPQVGGEPFRASEVSLKAAEIRYDRARGKLEPVTVLLSTDGARLTLDEVQVESPEEGVQDVQVRGHLELTRAFADQHPGLVGEVVFARLAGPFTFRGDVAEGRERAAGWTGTMEFTGAGIAAPYVQIETADIVGRIEGGNLVLGQIHAAVNGGTVDATATIGLVGEKPQHQLDLDAREVTIDGELAGLLARASPLLAVGESGRASGRSDVEAHLTAKGLDGDRLRKTVTGEGTVTLRDARVQSTNWIGKVLSVAGLGGDVLEFRPVTVPFKVQRGNVTTGNIDVSAVGLDLRLAGSVSRDGALDYSFGLRPQKTSKSFEKYAKLVDKDGFLPLRLEGEVSDPSLALPSVKDLLQGGGIKDILDRFRGKDDDDDAKDEDDKDEPAKKPRKKRKKKKKGKGKKKAADDPPPPAPPK